MNKGDHTTDIVGPHTAKEGLHDDLPAAEAKGDRDEDDLAVFGKRPQLKVRLPSPWHLSLDMYFDGDQGGSSLVSFAF